MKNLHALEGAAKPINSTVRLVGLDALRFFAVMLVLHIHAVQNFGVNSRATASSEPIGFLITWLAGRGRLGVDIFFVLSGFLVSGLFFTELARTGTISIGRFLIRRGFKIYPQFWVFTLVTVVWLSTSRQGVSLRALCNDLLFLQSYSPGLWPHTWTLAVEEHFYLLLAGVFFILKRAAAARNEKLNIRIFPKLCLAVALSCLGLRILTWFLFWGKGFTAESAKWMGSVSHVRMDSLFFGVLLAYYWHERCNRQMRMRLLSWRWLWLAGGAVLLSPILESLMDVEAWWIFGFISIYLGAGCLLLAALSLDYFLCPACFKWMAWLGRYSYSVYLWHMPVFFWLKAVFGTPSPTTGVFLARELAYIAVSWLLGILIARLIEFPMLRVRDKLFPAKN